MIQVATIVPYKWSPVEQQHQQLRKRHPTENTKENNGEYHDINND